jgi:hypothetical protein
MPAAYREIIGVCQQLPPLATLQSLANEMSDGTVTVATDKSLFSLVMAHIHGLLMA